MPFGLLIIIIVDAEIWSPFDRPDWFTNTCIDKGTDAAIHQFQQFLELLGPKSPFFFLSGLRSQKQIRDAGGFSGVNPPILKLVQGVYGKTV